MRISENLDRPITEKLDKAAAEMAVKNRKMVTSLISAMVLCIERGIATRGHRDSGMPQLSEYTSEDDYINLGNFKSIIRHMALSGDHNLKACLDSGSSNYAKYISAPAQLDMLQSILNGVQRAILDEAKSQHGKFMFALSVDEVTDLSVNEQLAIVVRTVSKDGQINERLLEYIQLESIRGKDVSDAVLDCLKRHDLDVSSCRAQTYDGAPNLSGAMNGCQAHIQKLASLAQYFHCASHKLNLALNSTTKVDEFRIMFQKLKSLGGFYHNSPKRTTNLTKVLECQPSVTVTKVWESN